MNRSRLVVAVSLVVLGAVLVAAVLLTFDWRFAAIWLGLLLVAVGWNIDPRVERPS